MRGSFTMAPWPPMISNDIMVVWFGRATVFLSFCRATVFLLFWMSNDFLQHEGGQWKEWQYIADARLLYYGFKWHNDDLARWQCCWFYHSACQMEQTDLQGVSMVAAAVALQLRWICCTWGCLVSLRCQLRPILYYNQLQWIPNGRRKMKRKKLGRRIGGSGVALLSIQMFQL